MPCVDDELWFLWTYEQRLRDVSAGWTLEHQIEAYEELDLIAHMTASPAIRARCVRALVARPDIGAVVKFGVAFDSDAARALFAEISAPGKMVEQWPANLIALCGNHDCGPWKRASLSAAEIDHHQPKDVYRYAQMAGRSGRGVVVAILDTGVAAGFDLA